LEGKTGSQEQHRKKDRGGGKSGGKSFFHLRHGKGKSATGIRRKNKKNGGGGKRRAGGNRKEKGKKKKSVMENCWPDQARGARTLQYVLLKGDKRNT